MSKGEDELRILLKEEYPYFTVIEQYTIKVGRQNLFLDFYLPQLSLAWEFDGQQHFTYTKHYHKTKKGFDESQRRDTIKDKYCKDQGITLIRIKYNEEVTKETLREKIKKCLDIS